MAGRPVHTFEVLRTENLTPHIVRVVLGGSGFDTFTPNDFTDAYVKIVFVRYGVDVGALPQPLTLDSFNELPVEERPTVRTYTVRSVDAERRRDRHRLRRARRARRRGPVGDGGEAWATGIPDGSQWRLCARSGGGLASDGRRRGGPSRDQRGAGSIARQRRRQGLHRGCRARRRDPAQGAAGCRAELDLPRRPRRPGVRGPGRRPRAADRGRQGGATGCPARCRSSSTARRRPSCTTCGPTSARNAASTPSGRTRSRAIGGAAAPRRPSGSGSVNFQQPRPETKDVCDTDQGWSLRVLT